MSFLHWLTSTDGVAHLVADTAAVAAATTGWTVGACGTRIAPGSLLAEAAEVCPRCGNQADVREIVTVHGFPRWWCRQFVRRRRAGRHRRPASRVD
jgi:predicted RNA-binding Zn-ribbon protein involved in translation (DUF1610 family)